MGFACFGSFYSGEFVEEILRKGGVSHSAFDKMSFNSFRLLLILISTQFTLLIVPKASYM